MKYPDFKQNSWIIIVFHDKQVTFAILAETEDLDRVRALVDELYTLLDKADRI